MIEKSIIIDFDNTIGYFDQIIYLFNIIEKILNIKLNNNDIFLLLDNYPFVFRPKIFEIFNMINMHKTNKNIKYFILYTCNNNSIFVEKIISYIEFKLKYSLFDYTLFNKNKIKNIEFIQNNTSNNININSILCFIDNKFFKYKNSNIKYIKCEEYIFNYKLEDILLLFPYNKFNIYKKDIQQYFELIYKKKKKKKKNNIQLPRKSYEINTNYIMHTLHSFCEDLL